MGESSAIAHIGRCASRRRTRLFGTFLSLCTLLTAAGSARAQWSEARSELLTPPGWEAPGASPQPGDEELLTPPGWSDAPPNPSCNELCSELVVPRDWSELSRAR